MWRGANGSRPRARRCVYTGTEPLPACARACVAACVRGRHLTPAENRRFQRGFTDGRCATTAGRLARSVLTTSALLRHLCAIEADTKAAGTTAEAAQSASWCLSALPFSFLVQEEVVSKKKKKKKKSLAARFRYSPASTSRCHPPGTGATGITAGTSSDCSEGALKSAVDFLLVFFSSKVFFCTAT